MTTPKRPATLCEAFQRTASIDPDAVALRAPGDTQHVVYGNTDYFLLSLVLMKLRAVDTLDAALAPLLEPLNITGIRSSKTLISDQPAGEAAKWPLGDPVERLKQHLVALGEWDEARHLALQAELTEAVRAAVKEGETVGSLGTSKPSVREMFEQLASREAKMVREGRERLLKSAIRS